MTFDDVLPTFVAICHGTRNFDELVDRACCVRDLRGRVRLVIKRKDGVDEAAFESLRAAAESALSIGLQGFFAGPVLRHPALAEAGRLAREVLDQAQPWQFPSYTDPASGSKVPVREGLWLRFERRLSKETWLDQKSSGPPWDLNSPPRFGGM